MNNELYHFGVKGMKWGVRRKRAAKIGSSFRKRQDKPEEIHEDWTKAHDKKSVKSMSDTELRARINRIQMEQQYAKLNPSVVSRGKSSVQSSLKTMTAIAATTGTILTLYNNTNKIRDLIEKHTGG